MEKPTANGQFVVLTNLRKNEATVDINAMKIENESLVPIDKLALDIFPGAVSHSMQSIHVPDYLGAVTGNRFCFVYSPESTKKVFALYQIDEANKKLNLRSEFEIDKIWPTAIIAIHDKVFLGFPGQVGVVDLTKPQLSLHVFHIWEEQTRREKPLKTIDAFAFDSTFPNSELVAIDDLIWPKYAFTYDVSQDPPKNTEKFSLPTGKNEHYKDAVKSGDRIVLTAKYGTEAREGNKIVVLKGTNPLWTISEHAPWGNKEKNRVLFVGDALTPHSSVGLLNKNIVLVTAGKRGVIAIPIDQIKREKKEMYGHNYDVSVPYGVKNLHVGASAEHLVTVKEKSTALVLGTTEKDSVLSEVKWNDKNDLEVVRSHNVQGLFERFFVES